MSNLAKLETRCNFANLTSPLKLSKSGRASLFIVFILTLLGTNLPVRAADAEFAQRLMKCTARVRYEVRRNDCLVTGHGTAFGVDLKAYGYSGNRYLLSACHNVLDQNDRPYPTLKIEIYDGSEKHWTTCTVAAVDKNLDLCLIEASEDLPAVLELDSTEVVPGTPIVMPGSPRGVPVAIYSGSVLERFERGSIRSSAKIIFDHGDSGAAMVNANTGKLAGVAVAGVPKDGDLDHTIGLFVPLAGVTSFLQSHQRVAPVLVASATPVVNAGERTQIAIAAEPVEMVVLKAKP